MEINNYWWIMIGQRLHYKNWATLRYPMEIDFPQYRAGLCNIITLKCFYDM